MYRQPLQCVLGACALNLALFGCSSTDNGADSEFGLLPMAIESSAGALIALSEEEALEADLNEIAAVNGWTFEEALRNHEAAEAVGRVAVELAERRPEAFVGSEVSLDANGSPTLYVKGPVDDVTREVVAAEKVAIIIADEQPYSFDELETRSDAVVEFLRALGFAELVSAVDITRGVVAVTIRPQAELPSDPELLLSGLPEPLQQDITIRLVDDDIAVADRGAGGLRMSLSGSNPCTSGFTVTVSGSATRRMSTAGHCTAKNVMEDIDGFDTHRLTLVSEHRGANGDVEIHSVRNGFNDDPAFLDRQFLSDTSSVNTATSVESAFDISVGEQICAFGRAVNVRKCENVNSVSMTCTYGGINQSKMVQMNQRLLGGGDSGGPWFVGGKAYGIHGGGCIGSGSIQLDSFSKAALLPAALGVAVTIN